MLGRDPAEHATLLDAACADDTELRAAVEQLLDGHRDAKAFLETPLVGSIAHASTADGPASASSVPTRIGQYRVIRELGRGGMGTVYLAERDDPALRKTVAI